MTKTLTKSKLFSNKFKHKPKPQIENNTSILPPILQSFEQTFLSGNGFLVYT